MNVLQFRMAMAKHLGHTITPEVAAAIEAEAFCEPDNSIDPAQFARVEYRGYFIQVESLRAILDELKPLHEAHWYETERHRHGLRLNARYDNMERRERAGQLLQFTARRGAELIGHLRMFLFESEHTSTLVSEEDTLYLKPEHRGSFLAIALLRYAEEMLVKLGCREIRANSKLINKADVLMRRMKYQPVALQFVKFLERNDHAREAPQREDAVDRVAAQTSFL